MFQYIQEYTGVVSPGILGVFLMGLFWKRTTSKAAIIGVITSIPVALALKLLPIQMPFLDQMMYTFFITIAIILFVSLSTAKTDEDPKAITMPKEIFKTGRNFNIAAYIVLIILVVIYTVFW